MEILALAIFVWILFQTIKWLLEPSVDHDITITVKKIDKGESVEAKFESVKSAKSFINQIEKDEQNISEFTISFTQRK